MPNRILKESICTSDSIDALTWFEEVMFYRLIVNCDDYGRFDGRMAVIKNRLFPLKDSITAKSVKDGINKLASMGLVSRYEVDGKPYLRLPTWNDHQSVRAKRSKYPAPVECMNTSEIICNHMHADASTCSRNPIQSESISESEYESESKLNAHAPKKFVPPSVEEVAKYCKERNNTVNPERFVDYYSSNGWMIGGKSKMKDWKAAVRTWESRQNESNRSYDNAQKANEPDDLEGIL